MNHLSQPGDFSTDFAPFQPAPRPQPKQTKINNAQVEQPAPATPPAPKPESKAKNAKIEKEVLCACVKFTYIGTESYKFKDPYGYTYIVEKDTIIVVPKGSLERHLKARKGLFKAL